MCNECPIKRVQRDIGLKVAATEHRRDGFDSFFDALRRLDESRMRAREVYLNALEAQCEATNKTDKNIVAILAAIQAEREAIAAAKKSAVVT
jgi:hypothetical protein